MGDWVELRVHGVHGTSPASMLGVRDDEVGQVAGDGVTGIYRVRPGTSVPLRTLEIPDDGAGRRRIAVEAYSWGALTSGVRGVLGWLRRLGWLLLLPFALANLAYWARLGVGASSARASWGAKLIRLAGLGLTIFMVLAPCVVAIDMIGWQCYRGGVPRCTNLPGLIGFLADWTAPQRLLLTSLFPVLVVLLLALLSRQTLNAYESVGPEYGLTSTQDPEVPTLPVVRRPYLWSAAARTRRLQRLHVAAGLSAVVVFVAPQVLHVSAHANGLTLLGVHLIAYDRLLMASLALAAATLLAAAVLVMVDHEQDLEYRGAASAGGVGQAPSQTKQGLLRRKLERALPFVAVMALVGQGWSLFRLRAAVSEVSTGYFGHNLWFVALFVLLTLLHLTVFVGERMSGRALVVAGLLAAVVVALVARLLWVDQHKNRDEMWWALAVVGVGWLLLVGWHYTRGSSGFGSKAWGGAGASVLLAAGAWIGLLFASSLVTASANWLNGPDRSVADLVTSTPDDPPSTDPSYKFYAASGNVTLHHAKFALTSAKNFGDVVVPGGVVIYSGTVTADRFNTVLNFIEGDDNAATTLRVGTTPVHQQTFLLLPKNADIAFEQSCKVADPDPQPRTGQVKPVRGLCRVGMPGYAEAGDIRVGGRTVTLVKGQGQEDATVPKHAKVTMQPLERIATPLVVPQVLVWTPLGQLLWLLVVALVLGAAVGVYTARAGRAIRDGLPLRGGSPPDSSIPEEDRLACQAKRSAAGLAHRAEALLDVVGLFTAPLALAITVCALTGDAPWDRPGLSWTRGIATAAMYLMLLTAGGLLLIASHLRRSESARKAVGVIWDLATFWPRAAHPLAPPCYAERVVPELDTRVRWALSEPGNQVILSGHSQGSLIVASMASRLENDLLGRIRLVTYGSQIRMLYGRIFPAVFGPDAIGYDATTGRSGLTSGFPDVGYGHDEPSAPIEESLRARLETPGGRWVNLFRRSDPLGFRVFSDNDSSLDVPVPEVPTEVHGDPGPAVQGHSGYQHSPQYRDLMCRWTDEIEYTAVHLDSSVIDVPLLPRA
ncbi:MAG: hypothetical protein ACJ72L_07135 [Marmoricola sp.]